MLPLQRKLAAVRVQLPLLGQDGAAAARAIIVTEMASAQCSEASMVNAQCSGEEIECICG